MYYLLTLISNIILKRLIRFFLKKYTRKSRKISFSCLNGSPDWPFFCMRTCIGYFCLLSFILLIFFRYKIFIVFENHWKYLKKSNCNASLDCNQGSFYGMFTGHATPFALLMKNFFPVAFSFWPSIFRHSKMCPCKEKFFKNWATCPAKTPITPWNSRCIWSLAIHLNWVQKTMKPVLESSFYLIIKSASNYLIRVWSGW